MTLALEKLAHFHALTFSYGKVNGITNFEDKFDFFNQIFKDFEVIIFADSHSYICKLRLHKCTMTRSLITLPLVTLFSTVVTESLNFSVRQWFHLKTTPYCNYFIYMLDPSEKLPSTVIKIIDDSIFNFTFRSYLAFWDFFIFYPIPYSTIYKFI